MSCFEKYMQCYGNDLIYKEIELMKYANKCKTEISDHMYVIAWYLGDAHCTLHKDTL